MCVGKQVVLPCQQAGGAASWTVHPPLRMTLFGSVTPSQSGISTFRNDEFGFTIHLLSSNDTTFRSELRVTAVRQLHGTRVLCQGASGTFNFTIHVASVGKLAHSYSQCHVNFTLESEDHLWLYPCLV